MRPLVCAGSRMKNYLKILAMALFALTGAAGWLRMPEAAAQAGRVDFARDIQPIFQAACVSCHSARKVRGQLRLDAKALAMKGGLTGAAITPGDGANSLLVRRLLGSDGQARMPMGAEALRPEQIALIKRWIDEGANWPEDSAAAAAGARHWSYVIPVRPALPAVSNKQWPRNPIDHFVLARLEKEGLAPAPEAAREILLRRVSLDLTGLPPTVREIDEFLADKSPDAYEKAVDRLLASPHYGERWARPWLDLARYADSNGYEKDNLRVMWKYRDWVINALNQDMPYDQFTIEQLAGDMLPSPTQDQLIATGFHRNTMLNQEGGVDPEEARYEVLVDRVNTTSTVWLGSTMACAQCHNHKYDPISQKDYYRMYAFFENAAYEIGYQGEKVDHTRYILEPVLEMPTPEQEAKRASLKKEIEAIEATMKADTPELAKAQAAWEREILEAPAKWTALDPREYKSVGGATLTKQADLSLLASGAAPEYDEYIIRVRAGLKKITGLRI
ncbi:MAG: DUF1549 domain-containing protein, partial [Blastocatellia bacterium]